MNTYRADLHIHSVLSPCGDLDMSPGKIVDEAVRKGLDMIAVTDHNHTGHARLARKLGARKGIWVVYGVEVTTQEEVHCLTFFDTDEQLGAFQMALDANMPKVKNDTSLFGYQVIVDEKEQILEEISHSLYPGVGWGIEELAGIVHELGGLFIPAHVDRPMNGLYAQLGIWPEDLEADGVEVSWRTDTGDFLGKHPELVAHSLIHNSDAHYLDDIGRAFSAYRMKSRNFMELRMALRGEEGRGVEA